MQTAALPILLFFAAVLGLALLLLLVGRVFNPARPGRVKQMPYESGMDPIHDTRRRFDVRFHLLAIAFLVFDVELLFLYPWAVAVRDRARRRGRPDGMTPDRCRPLPGLRQAASSQPLVRPVFAGGMVFLVLADTRLRLRLAQGGFPVAVELPDNVVVTKLDKLVSWCRKNSLWPMPFATACCGIELMATGASRHDMARFGAEVFRFSPRQCDLMIVAGRVVMKMLPVLQRIWQQMHEPKWCISMGACASTGGVFDTYSRGPRDRPLHARWTCTCPAARRGPSN